MMMRMMDAQCLSKDFTTTSIVGGSVFFSVVLPDIPGPETPMLRTYTDRMTKFNMVNWNQHHVLEGVLG